MNSNQPQNMNQLNMDDLVYNIETKISLLSQIEQNIGLLKNNDNNYHNNKQKVANTITNENTNNNSNEQQFQQDLNLPMQILNKKMMEILNNNNNNDNQRNIMQENKYDSKYERTMDKKKRMDLNQLQTGTRNIDEMKCRQTTDDVNRSGIKIRHLYHNQHQGVEQYVKEFKQNNQSELYNMNQQQSIMNSSNSKSSSSRIINKFNSIQLNYMDKIKSLTFKVSLLQQRLQQSQQEKNDLIGSLETYKSLYTRKQSQIDKQIQHKLQQIKSSLIEKFAEQCRVKYNQYICQLKQITMLLNQQKKKRKFYQQQNKVLKLQKENYQQMYKSLLNKQKQYLRIDIDRTRNQLNFSSNNNHNVQISQQGVYMSANNNDDNNIEPEYSQIENKQYPDNSMIFLKQPLVKGSNNFIQQKYSTQSIKKTQKSKSKSKNKSQDKNKSFSDKNRQSSSLSKDKQSKKRVSIQKEKQSKTKTKTKSKSKSKSKTKSNSQQIQMKQEMTKQQLIPFLAKGIQQLKQRLQMK